MAKLEVCVDNVTSALNAFRGGASRLELCSSLNLGGLTPSLELFESVKKLTLSKCTIFIMIRPKPGEDYVYSENELKVMQKDILLFKKNGADGFVFGCLTESKEVDEDACKQLLKAAEGFPCTFHRAFDVVKDPEGSLMILNRLGFSRILTSGQEKNAFLGRNLIKKLVTKIKDLDSKLIVMPGGGVNVNNLKEILEATGVKEFHGSARNTAGSTSGQEGEAWITDESIVREMIQIAEKIKF